MADNKKSFVLYCDLIHTVRKMPKEKIADLFLHILSYVNDENPNTDDLIIQLTFEPIKQQLKRDLIKYENRVNSNKINGLKGGRPKKPKKPNGLNENPTKPKKADNDTVNDNDSDNVIDIREINFSIFWEKYGKKVDNKKSRKIFFSLSEKDINDILEAVDKYVLSTPDVRFRKNPSTYLNGRCWEDEILNNKLNDNCNPPPHTINIYAGL